MDIRGIEVTNQLRSAIRAKLLELGVRYDEELPDYILVMVVNKKSRQQMHDDLFLFLEDSTTPFVDWLHDQVLKKLQKVTVAKKKTTKEFVPTVVIKKEEDKKKKKVTTTSFLQDFNADESNEKPVNKNSAEDKSVNKHNQKVSAPSQSCDGNQKKDVGKLTKEVNSDKRQEDPSLSTGREENSTDKQQQLNMSQSNTIVADTVPPETLINKSADLSRNGKNEDLPSKSLKRPFEKITVNSSVEKCKDTTRSQLTDDESSPVEEVSSKRLKSAVNKPRITSVVSIKNRLGITSPRKKFEVYREKLDNKSRYAQNDKRFDKRFNNNTNRRNGFQRGRNLLETEESRLDTKRGRELDTKTREPEKGNDIKNRLGTTRGDKLGKANDLREKAIIPKAKTIEKMSGTVKDRLGISNSDKPLKQSLKSINSVDHKSTKLEQMRESLINNKNKNIKNRLGPLKNNFRPISNRGNVSLSAKRSQSSEDDDYLNLGVEDELDDDTESVVNAGPVRSHIIAVQKPMSMQPAKKRPNISDKLNNGANSDDEDDDEEEEVKIPSKVIVTPRPLKPLQPTQKRATQSLLLRAVAEANQSVVAQKNPEPSLLDKKRALKRLRPVGSREINQNLSVRLNASKRLVMERIQVELSTEDSTNPKTKPPLNAQEGVTDDHMGVVMSLFQRSDDKQKFLVTLNGYNNNMLKEKVASDDDERLEMEVNEDDELALLSSQSDVYIDQSESASEAFQITDPEDSGETHLKEDDDENNENCNIENVEVAEESSPPKRRRLSPIVYNRSPSPNPVKAKKPAILTTLASKPLEKKPVTGNTVPTVVIEKSRERCRYWPNCTLGNKCAFLHPAVMCSVFPACKFGDKCAYKHPKCKFGISCTKLGCIFSHPTQQCKYHPFCTKPGCPYSHPSTTPAVISVETSNQRAKFTWRRRD